MAEWIREFLIDFGVTAIFIAILLEYSCFPVPSEVILPTSGAMALSLGISFWYILMLATVAGLGGSLFCYYIGYWGRDKLLALLIRRFPKIKPKIDNSLKFYKRYANFSVAAGRVIPLCRTYISFVAGAARQKTGHFILFSTIGIFVWNGILIGSGYLFYNHIALILKLFTDYKIFTAYILLALIAYLLYQPKFRIIKKSIISLET